MKIIKPETPQKQEAKKEEKIIIEPATKKDENLKPDLIQETQSIEDIMNDVINKGTNNITFTITLTKRQYELWIKKGAESWLKKALVGQKIGRKNRK